MHWVLRWIHVIYLLGRQRVWAYWHATSGNDLLGWYIPEKRCVHIPYITSSAAYAVALHELGHSVACPEQQAAEQVREQLFTTTTSYSWSIVNWQQYPREADIIYQCEVAAWRWARQHALDWTKEMDQLEQRGLMSYKEWLHINTQ